MRQAGYCLLVIGFAGVAEPRLGRIAARVRMYRLGVVRVAWDDAVAAFVHRDAT